MTKKALCLSPRMQRYLRAFGGALLSVFVLLGSSYSPAKHPKIQIRIPTYQSEARDLEAIYMSGELRVLLRQDSFNDDSLNQREVNMLGRFAEENGLFLRWIPLENEWQLLSHLVSGRGDIVVGEGKSLQAGLKSQVRFTLPLLANHHRVVMRDDADRINSLQELGNLRTAVKTSSPLWDTVQRIAASGNGMQLITVDESVSGQEIMRRVSEKSYDAAILSWETLNNYLPEYPDLSATYQIPVGEPRVWAVPNDAPQLQSALNEFLNKNHLQFSMGDTYLEDLSRLKERRTLRMITNKNPGNYFFAKGRSQGFEYELLKRFAKLHQMRLEVVLANSHEEMMQLLLQGSGDVIAASLSQMAFHGLGAGLTRPYNYSVPVIVGHAHDDNPIDISELTGHTIVIPVSSPYHRQLERLKDSYAFRLEYAHRDEDMASIIQNIENGSDVITVIDNHLLKQHIKNNKKIKVYFPLSEPLPQSWVVRKNNEELLTALNQYIKDEYRGDFYNILYADYFGDSRFDEQFEVFASTQRLSPFDAVVKDYAEQYDFDWRLIIAQMYQESQFDPKALSYAGAEGLMQMLPSTADWIGAENIDEPVNNIKAGIAYMDMLRSQFEEELTLQERTWFTLAAYNAGFGRIKQARELAVKMDLDPNRWFGHVEEAMLALSMPYKKDGQLVRICRCGQTVIYVNEIRALYNTYVRLTDNTRLAGLAASSKPGG